RAQNFRGQYPQPLAGPLTLNPEQVEVVEVAETWVSGDQRRIISGIDGVMGPHVNDANCIQMYDDERWQLLIHVAGENIEPTQMRIRVIAGPQNQLDMTLEYDA